MGLSGSPLCSALPASSWRSIAASSPRRGSFPVPILSVSPPSRPKSGEGSGADRGSWPKMLRNRLKTNESTSSRERVLSIAVWGCKVARDLCFNLPSLESRERTALAWEFARYLKVRGAWGASWSPDGRRLAFLTEITGVPQVWEVEAGGPSWPEQLTFYEERVSGAEYSPTHDRLLFGMDAGGNERTQLYLLENGEATDLTRAPGAIHYPGGFSPDGDRVAYTTTRPNGTDFDVFVQELDGEPEMVWEVPGY